jgi:NADH:ubiquinone oxidoreductase subunit 3 (subunit A)
LLPWVLGGISTGTSGFFALRLFLVVLVIGFVFEWQKGALEWSSFLKCPFLASELNQRLWFFIFFLLFIKILNICIFFHKFLCISFFFLK